jgi:protein TonB
MRPLLMPIACAAMMLAACDTLENRGNADTRAYRTIATTEWATVVKPPWAEDSPTAADIRKVYPAGAMEAGIASRVVLRCSILETRSLACAVDSEDQPGYGFGEAALTVSRMFRLKPAEPGSPTAVGRQVRLPIRFELE